MASKTWFSSDVALTFLVELGYRSVDGHLLYYVASALGGSEKKLLRLQGNTGTP